MNLVVSVTPEDRIHVGMRHDQYGEPLDGFIAQLTPTEARAFASQVIARADLADRRIRTKARSLQSP